MSSSQSTISRIWSVVTLLAGVFGGVTIAVQVQVQGSSQKPATQVAPSLVAPTNSEKTTPTPTTTTPQPCQQKIILVPVKQRSGCGG